MEDKVEIEINIGGEIVWNVWRKDYACRKNVWRKDYKEDDDGMYEGVDKTIKHVTKTSMVGIWKVRKIYSIYSMALCGCKERRKKVFVLIRKEIIDSEKRRVE